MANNVTLDPMIGGSVVKTTEDASQYHHQHVIGEFKDVDNSNVPTAVDQNNPFPVEATALETRLGEVQASPTANTVLARLKNIEGYLDSVEGYIDGIEALLTTIDADTSSLNDQVAHDAVDSGKPIKVGHKAIAHGTNPTAVAAGDRTDGYANRAGIPFVQPGHPNIITRSHRVDDADGAQTDAALVTVSAGTKIVVVGLEAMTDADTTDPTAVKVGFGATTLPASAETGVNGILLEHPGVAPGSGVVKGFAGAILGVGADGEDLRLTCEDPAGGSLVVTYSYYTIES